MSDLPETADVVIVGGGSAGAVLAARLSQDPARTVLLLEAGPAYAPDAFPPALLDARILDDPRHDWGYTARATDQAVNAGVAIRPRPADFAKWGPHGADGWSFADVLPTFKLMENNPGGEDAYHGRTGPLPVRQLTDEELTPSQAGFIGAAVARGFKRVRDFNGADQDGVGGHSVNVVNGIRENAAIVFLTAEVRRRPNLTIRGDVTIDRVLFDGTAATGVVAADDTVYRAGEVILSAGSYGSPAILLRSGVGPADELTALGIGVVADLPVGRRLLDHPYFHTAHALAPGHLEMTPAVGAILWTASSEAAPGELDLNITATHLLPPSYSPTGGVIALSASVVLPESTGTLKLASRDPGVAPLIDCNFLATGRDARRMLEGVKLARDFARSPDLASFIAGELTPGDTVADDRTWPRSSPATWPPTTTPPPPPPWAGRPTRRPSWTRSAPSWGPADCGSSMPRSSPTPRPRSSTSPS
jgi:choline dehydrogenase